MPVEYTLAPEVGVIARSMIESFHTHLREARIAYTFVDKAQSFSDGRTILGRAKGRTNLDRLLSPNREDFVMIISKDKWENMTEEKKRYLVDHELCHMGIVVNTKGESKFALRGHQIEEFPENLGRFQFRLDEIGLLIEHPPSAIKATQTTRAIQAGSEEE